MISDHWATLLTILTNPLILWVRRASRSRAGSGFDGLTLPGKGDKWVFPSLLLGSEIEREEWVALLPSSAFSDTTCFVLNGGRCRGRTDLFTAKNEWKNHAIAWYNRAL